MEKIKHVPGAVDFRIQEPNDELQFNWASLLGGDLNPPLGFYFPLFSMSFAREFPSGWKTTESSGNKIVVFL